MILLMLVTMSASGSFAQTSIPSNLIPGEPIVKQGKTYYVGNHELTAADLDEAFLQNDLAWEYSRQANGWEYVSTIFGLAGGALIGYGAASLAMRNIMKNPDSYKSQLLYGTTLLAVGLGCTAIANHKLHKAIDAYNDGLASPATDDLSLHVGVTSDGGVGLTLSF